MSQSPNFVNSNLEEEYNFIINNTYFRKHTSPIWLVCIFTQELSSNQSEKNKRTVVEEGNLIEHDAISVLLTIKFTLPEMNLPAKFVKKITKK